MLEKKMNKKQFRMMVYVVGCILELIGFFLLFNPDGALTFITNYATWIGAFIVFSGYVVAVAMRFKN